MEKADFLSIDEYVKMLICDRSFRNEEYREYVKNCYSINNITGFISSDVLKQVIMYAKRNHKIKNMLADILLYVNAFSMTDENFQMLLKFPIKYRNTYLSNLCHAQLSFYQMQILNRYPLALEAFVWLFDKICYYDCFTTEDMLCILRENPDVRPAVIMDCINLAFKHYGQSDKIQVAQTWILTHNKTD